VKVERRAYVTDNTSKRLAGPPEKRGGPYILGVQPATREVLQGYREDRSDIKNRKRALIGGASRVGGPNQSKSVER